jgi:hypothetical protein
MTDHQNELAALRRFVSKPLPTTREAWPEFKAEHEQAERLVQAMTAEEDWNAKLAVLNGLGWDLQLATRARHYENQRELIADIVERINKAFSS